MCIAVYPFSRPSHFISHMNRLLKMRDKQSKKKYWQGDEVCVLLDSVQENYHQLTSKFSKTMTKRDRDKIWDNIGDR